jgi:hypothetical protein
VNILQGKGDNPPAARPEINVITNIAISIRSVLCCIVRLTSINLQKNLFKNPVFKSTIFFLDVY